MSPQVERRPPASVALAGLLLVLSVAHLTTGDFILDPARALVFSDGLEVPFSDLRVPRITTKTYLSPAGESADPLQEVLGNVIESGGRVFFHTGGLSAGRLAKIANALNDAIREYDERFAVRQWLEDRGELHD